MSYGPDPVSCTWNCLINHDPSLPKLSPFICDKLLQTIPGHQVLFPRVQIYIVFLMVISFLSCKHCYVRVLLRGHLEHIDRIYLFTYLFLLAEFGSFTLGCKARV